MKKLFNPDGTIDKSIVRYDKPFKVIMGKTNPGITNRFACSQSYGTWECWFESFKDTELERFMKAESEGRSVFNYLETISSVAIPEVKRVSFDGETFIETTEWGKNPIAYMMPRDGDKMVCTINLPRAEVACRERKR